MRKDNKRTRRSPPTRGNSISAEIACLRMQRPHVVILGAGASRAAFPQGDRHHRRLPLMNDFCEIVPVAHLLSDARITTQGRNFEHVYYELTTDRSSAGIRDDVERVVREYFATLELPDTPTVYDHLILSLRPKDIIASFNWDPLLLQAAERNWHVAGCPHVVFLHGNVRDAYCETDNVHGSIDEDCSKCGRPFQPTPLLYPIQEKNYETHPAIKSSWRSVNRALKSAFMVTIFGYGAPESDQAAMALLLGAWGGWEKRELEQFEIIDVRAKD